MVAWPQFSPMNGSRESNQRRAVESNRQSWYSGTPNTISLSQSQPLQKCNDWTWKDFPLSKCAQTQISTKMQYWILKFEFGAFVSEADLHLITTFSLLFCCFLFPFFSIPVRIIAHLLPIRTDHMLSELYITLHHWCNKTKMKKTLSTLSFLYLHVFF